MPAFLLHIILPSGHASLVKELLKAPETALGVNDLARTLAMELAEPVVGVVGWDILPNAGSHPGSGPYWYWVGYSYKSKDTIGWGHAAVKRPAPILTTDDLRAAEASLAVDAHVDEITVISCKALRAP